MKKILSVILIIAVAGSLICGSAINAYAVDFTELKQDVHIDRKENCLDIRYEVLLPNKYECYAVFTFNGAQAVWTDNSGPDSIGSNHSCQSGDNIVYYDLGTRIFTSGSETLGEQKYKALNNSSGTNNIEEKSWCSKCIYTDALFTYTRKLDEHPYHFKLYGLSTRKLTGISFYCYSKKDGTGEYFKHIDISDYVVQMAPEDKPEPVATELTVKAGIPADSYDPSYGDVVLPYTVTDNTTSVKYYINIPIGAGSLLEDGCLIGEKKIIIMGTDYDVCLTRSVRKYYVTDSRADGMAVTFTMGECNPGGLAHNIYEDGW